MPPSCVQRAAEPQNKLNHQACGWWVVGTDVGGPHWIPRLAFDFVLTLHLHYLFHIFRK